MKIGILGTADIAFRRFLPALQKCHDVIYAGVASRTPAKTTRFVETFGGHAYPSYDALLADETIDAVYVPLPPALHFEWGKRALEAGKHLLMEKPFTTSVEETEILLTLAEQKRLAVHENYMFLYHEQLAKVKELITADDFGEPRLLRAAFGFPKRGADDFRYNKSLGGGALLDCGGYPVRLALELLGDSARVTQANLSWPTGFEVDLFGSAVLENKDGLCAQISFGMDNSYKCELEVWGSNSCLMTERIFTAPDDFAPVIRLRRAQEEQLITLPPDNSFKKSINVFLNCVNSASARSVHAKGIRQESALVEQVFLLSH